MAQRLDDVAHILSTLSKADTQCDLDVHMEQNATLTLVLPGSNRANMGLCVR